MSRTLAISAFFGAVLLLAMQLPAQSQYPQVQPYPQGSTFGSPSPQQPQVQYGGHPPAYGQPPVQYGQGQPYDSSQGGQYENENYQNGQGQQDMAADQQHGVGRLSVADGQVNVRRGDTGDLVAAAVNAPLMSQDHLQTSADGRAEVELDYGSVIRLAPNTDLGLADLEYHKYQVTLGVGTILYRVLRDSGAQAEVDTPSVAVHPTRIGEYRISVYDDGAAQITVRSGALELLGPSGSQWLSAGQSVLVQGNSGNAQLQDVAPPQFDQLDGWSRDRDRQMLGARSYSYVSPDVAGADDLDANGNWVPSQYGEVWAPRAPVADWAPYSYGNWSYEPYYGWTWVDSAPWGWAPYHYGRWFQNGGYGWCWWPGGRRFGFGWSPAAVGFYGVAGGIGWVALAPFEPFFRWWGFGFNVGFHFGGGWGYGRGDLWHTYHNLGFRGGAIWSPYDRFGARGAGRYGFAGRAELSRASWLSGGHFPVRPTRASYSFSSRAAYANPRLAVASNRTFFHTGQTSGGYGRGGYGRGPVSNGRFGAQNNGSRGFAASSNSNGWHSFGQPGNSAAVRQGSYGAQQQGGAWHSFGQAEHGIPANRGATYNGYSAPRYSAPSYNNGGYNSRSYSAPHYAAPSYSAPRYSAPSRNESRVSNNERGGGGHASAPHYSGGGGSHGGGGGHSGGHGGGRH